MGTNYYWYAQEPCPCCGRDYEPIHIGKSSAGWHFGLHIYPEDKIHTLNDWIRKIETKGGIIKNEYGDKLSLQELINTIKYRGSTEPFWPDGWWNHPWYQYTSEEQFHKQNQSERGINGLLRRKISSHCVGYGDGPYDYCVGYFS